MRRRANASPDCEGVATTPSSTQGLRIVDAPFRPVSPPLSHRSPLGRLPALVGSPPRRDQRPTLTSSNSMHSNSSRGANSPPPSSCFTASHGGGGGGGSIGVGLSVAGGSECPPPGTLQLSSPWSSQSYPGGGGAHGAGNIGAAAPSASS
ncbi:unnamed protein product, partial [Laminaria digitata]